MELEACVPFYSQWLYIILLYGSNCVKLKFPAPGDAENYCPYYHFFFLVMLGTQIMDLGV